MDTRVYFASRRGFLKGLALGAGGYALGSSLIHLPEAMGQQHSPEQKEVWKMEEASWEFFKQKDLEKYLTLWHKDAEVWGYAAEGPKPKRFYERGYEGKKWFPVPSEKLPGKEISYKLASPSINIHDNIALVFYRCTIEGVDTFPFVARVFHVWEKQGKNGSLSAACMQKNNSIKGHHVRDRSSETNPNLKHMDTPETGPEKPCLIYFLR